MYMYFSITGVKKIISFIKNFVLLRFVISRFHCIEKAKVSSVPYLFDYKPILAKSRDPKL